MDENVNTQHETSNKNDEKLDDENNKSNEPKNQINNNSNGNQSKLNSVVVSVKKFVESDNDLDEVTVSVVFFLFLN